MLFSENVLDLGYVTQHGPVMESLPQNPRPRPHHSRPRPSPDHSRPRPPSLTWTCVYQMLFVVEKCTTRSSSVYVHYEFKIVNR